MKRSVCFSVSFLLFALVPRALSAGEHPVTAEVSSFFYADNTEFIGDPYRDGETLLGEQLHLSLDVLTANNVHLRFGVQTDTRSGDSKAFRSVWPILAFEIGGPKNRLVLGTLRSGVFGREVSEGLWPDESGPHGLLPPLQVDTLSITQSNDAGLQWLCRSGPFNNDLWIAWRRLNTESQRERFDAGLNSRLVAMKTSHVSLAIAAQGHVYHQGGQLTHEGAVGDSMAGGVGAQSEIRMGHGVLRVEAFALRSKNDPDRGDTLRADHLNGHGVFVRASYEIANWRGAWIHWTGVDFIKTEGPQLRSPPER